MVAVVAARAAAEDPLSALEVLDEAPPPAVPPPDDWVPVEVRAAALNHHDVWSLRGVGLRAELLPMVLGSDAAGLDPDGREVVVHAVVSSPDWSGDETLDPGRSLLSERFPGTLADTVLVPRRNLVAKPAALTWAEAACLPTAWLTAYRMLVVRSGALPGSTVLVQGAGGGVSTALVVLGRALGYRVWVTSRDEAKLAQALELGADRALAAGERVPERVDAVMETVGQATWAHSVRSLRPGGTIVVAGATSGDAPSAELRRVFFHQLRVVGVTMGSCEDLGRLLSLLDTTGVRPVVDAELPMAQAREGLARLVDGTVRGKVVLTAG